MNRTKLLLIPALFTFIGSLPSAAAAAASEESWSAYWIGAEATPGLNEPPAIVISKALYGVSGNPSRQVDVRPEIERQLLTGNYEITPGMRLIGRDPAPGAVKTLELEYSIDGEHVQCNLAVNESYSLVIQAPEVVITDARYGVRGDPERQVDVTGRIQQAIESGSYRVTAQNKLAGRDPAYGVKKTLELEYTVDGARHQHTLDEGESLKLTSGDNEASLKDAPLPGANQWIAFRREFRLDQVPGKAIARIAADSKYWLWVNGEMVVFEGQLKRGPTPDDTYFDRVDLAGYLREGDNTVAILLWYFGKQGFSHNSSGKAGFVFDAQIDGQALLSDSDWKALIHPAYGNTGAPHPNFRLAESNIRFNAAQDMAGWQEPDYDAAAWPAAIELGQPPCAPWHQLVERPIPLWKDFGLKDYVNAAELPAVSDGTVIKAKLPYNAQVTPYLKIEGPAGQVVDIRMDNYRGGGPPNVRAEYVTRDGLQEYENLGWMNGHEMHYTIPAGFKIHALKYRETGYDTDFTGSFECDDAFLNKYREKALRTLYVNMRDTYFDCPDRERSQWWGDVVNELGEAFYALDVKSHDLARKGILELANWQRSDDTLFSPVPAGNWNRELPMQMLNSVGYYGFWTYYLNTGDLETIRAVYPAVKRYMALWQLGADGLVVHRNGGWLWGDWGENRDMTVLFNGWYYLALKGQKLMAKALGEAGDVPAIEARMQRVEANFNSTFWTGSEYRSPDYEGLTDDRAQALAVLAGFADAAMYPAIRDVLRVQEHSSPYMDKYVGEALYLMRDEEDAVARTKKRFKRMVESETSTLWEHYSSRNAMNHGWAGGGLTLLSQYGAGVAPVEPGYERYQVLPQMGPLKRIKTTVPSVKGAIQLELKRAEDSFAMKLLSPDATTAVIGIPKRAGQSIVRIKANGKTVWKGKTVKRLPSGIKFLKECPNYVQFSVQPGTWDLEASYTKAQSTEAFEVSRLLCEYLKDPLGIDLLKPNLSWQTQTAVRGWSQSAYRVLVASSPEVLARNEGDLWDSGKVLSGNSTQVTYEGRPLKSGQRCYWKAMVWDQQDRFSAWSEPAHWSIGLLDPDDWEAQWIGLDSHPIDQDPAMDPDRKTKDRKHETEEDWHAYITAEIKECELPARYVRREFELPKRIKRATAYVSGLGFYELFVNGNEVEDERMQPGLTLYNKRIFYVTHDLTASLRKGRNALGVILGNGRFWSPRRFTPAKYYHGGTPRLLFQMHIEYVDGTEERLLSDASWQITDQGPIRLNNEYDGEHYDARMEMPGWSAVGFDASGWQAADLMPAPGGRMQAQMIEPMRVVEEVKPVSVVPHRDGYIVDMGQSFYGNVRLRVKGAAGTEVSMTSAYSLNEDGSLRVRDNREALCKDVYVLKGKGEEVWAPRFKGQGFRRVWVQGWPGVPTVDNFVGQVLSMDLPESGDFTCSDPLLNQIHSNCRWTQRMYLRSVPMDPDRDERQGWTGDQNQNVLSYSYSWKVFPFFRKWMEDMRVDQLANGILPAVSPTYWYFYPYGHIWPSGITLIPEILRTQYGDRRVIDENYDAAHKWMRFLESRRLDQAGIFHKGDWGDWQEVSVNIGKGKTTPIALIETAYFFHHCGLMEKTALKLGRLGDAAHYQKLGEKTKLAFNQKFFNPVTGVYAKGAQTTYALVLMFDLVPSASRQKVIENFINSIQVKSGGHPSSGMVGMQWIFQALDEIDRNDVALEMLQKEAFPSWGYMISRGATSIWEKWNSDTAGPGMNSQGLLFLGGNINAWLFECLAGLRPDPTNPGFKHIIFKPHLLGDLTFAQAKYQSPYGEVLSDWNFAGGSLDWSIVVPPNSRGTVYLPASKIETVRINGEQAASTQTVRFLRTEGDRLVYSVGAGKYRFNVEKDQ